MTRATGVNTAAANAEFTGAGDTHMQHRPTRIMLLTRKSPELKQDFLESHVNLMFWGALAKEIFVFLQSLLVGFVNQTFPSHFVLFIDDFVFVVCTGCFY